MRPSRETVVAFLTGKGLLLSIYGVTRVRLVWKQSRSAEANPYGSFHGAEEGKVSKTHALLYVIKGKYLKMLQPRKESLTCCALKALCLLL